MDENNPREMKDFEPNDYNSLKAYLKKNWAMKTENQKQMPSKDIFDVIKNEIKTWWTFNLETWELD